MTPSDQARPSALRRLLPLIAVLLVPAVVIALGWHRHLSFETLERHHAVIHAFVAHNLPFAVAAYIALYVAVVTLSVPGSAFLTIAGGMLFGAAVGGAAAAVGATVGAICIFLIASSALGELLLRRAGPRAQRLAAGFRADAFNYLLFLRLVAVFPFWLVNLVAALAGIRLKTFAAATAIGILPATFVLAFVGASLESVVARELAEFRTCIAAAQPDCRFDFDPLSGSTLKLLAALALLGMVALLPVLARRMKARSRPAIPPG
jgi:uncharacterized membrane protein YdjX (TVP38/TMEM64 family)